MTTQEETVIRISKTQAEKRFMQKPFSDKKNVLNPSFLKAVDTTGILLIIVISLKPYLVMSN